MEELRTRQQKELEKMGIHNLEELNKAIAEQKPLDITLMVAVVVEQVKSA